VTGYLDITDRLLHAIADGEIAPGAPLPSIRTLARELSSTPTTVARAYGELARTGVIATTTRRAARVAADGPPRARRRLDGDRALVLAGSDDPLLDLAVAGAGAGVQRRAAAGSFGGLRALWSGQAQAATLHLWHAGGEHNGPYAARVLAGQEPTLVRLWRREQGLVVAPGNPHAIERVHDTTRVTVAQRRTGTGTRALLDRLLRERGLDPGDVRGPELDSHLDVALAVATGSADTGVAVRSAAAALGLDFVTLAWEPFDLALPARWLGAAGPLLDAIATTAVRDRATQLGGYDLEACGSIRALA